jgi:hypothetical protein
MTDTLRKPEYSERAELGRELTVSFKVPGVVIEK